MLTTIDDDLKGKLLCEFLKSTTCNSLLQSNFIQKCEIIINNGKFV